MSRAVADLGNSRLKWGRIDDAGRLAEVVALPLDDESEWNAVWQRWRPSEWCVATVNPPAADRLGSFLDARGASVRWFRSAVDVSIVHILERPDLTGADRALAVAAAVGNLPRGTPGLVVLCGTAITVERVDAGGTWQGGAIAAGLSLTARALNQMTAQLPLVETSNLSEPAAWGVTTRSALEAGVFWGVVGSIRELIMRQSAAMSVAPRVLWTGGDAARLAAAVNRSGSRVVPDLVLLGLARVGFGGAGVET